MSSRRMGKKESELVAKKIEAERAEMKKFGLDYIDEETALAKYRKGISQNK